MSGDKAVGKWESETFTLIDKTLAPMYLVSTGNVSRWLETRAIDYHRANSAKSLYMSSGNILDLIRRNMFTAPKAL